VDAPEIPFWNVIAHDDHQGMIREWAAMTFEEQGAQLRETIPGFVP
jgi:hypothetical protein